MRKITLRSAAAVLRRRLHTKATMVLLKHERLQTSSTPAVIVPVSMDNVQDAEAFDPPRRIEEFRSFLTRGDRGVYAYLAGRCVHRSWVVLNQRAHLHWALEYELADDEIFIHYCETAPEARGLGIYPAVLARIVTDLGAGRSVLICVDETNTASIRGVQKAGFVECARVDIRVLCGLTFPIVRRIGRRDRVLGLRRVVSDRDLA